MIIKNPRIVRIKEVDEAVVVAVVTNRVVEVDARTDAAEVVLDVATVVVGDADAVAAPERVVVEVSSR